MMLILIILVHCHSCSSRSYFRGLTKYKDDIQTWMLMAACNCTLLLTRGFQTSDPLNALGTSVLCISLSGLHSQQAHDVALTVVLTLIMIF